MTIEMKKVNFILAFKKNVLSLHHQKVIWCDEFVAQQVEHNTFNVGVLGSSPSEFTRRQSSDCRFFLFVVQLCCYRQNEYYRLYASILEILLLS